MNKILLFWVLVILPLSSCTTLSLEQASINYKKYHDYASLETIYRHLAKGMRRTEAEHLLGEPDYSPIEGQCYYSSDREEDSANGNDGHSKVPVGIILDYRDKKGVSTGKIQTFQMGPIGE